MLGIYILEYFHITCADTTPQLHNVILSNALNQIYHSILVNTTDALRVLLFTLEYCLLQEHSTNDVVCYYTKQLCEKKSILSGFLGTLTQTESVYKIK